ncbi:hypothetical protein [Spirosoma pollinicola]|uniref:hypothetical protein n=1 Tax=Spirosoma pollinicola TaxID=2057025 RepID=UPI0012FE5B03|nr:hypothetical protein [Spirosoma pollinicola]
MSQTKPDRSHGEPTGPPEPTGLTGAAPAVGLPADKTRPAARPSYPPPPKPGRMAGGLFASDPA